MQWRALIAGVMLVPNEAEPRRSATLTESAGSGTPMCTQTVEL